MTTRADEVCDTLLSKIEELVFVLDFQGNILYANKAVQQLLGYTENELLVMSFLSLHPESDRETVAGTLKSVAAGENEKNRTSMETKAGRQIMVETKMHRGYWGETVALIGITKNITDIMNANLKFAKAFNDASSVMAITDFETGQFIDVNSTFLASLGYEKHEVIGKTVYDLQFYEDFYDRDTILQATKAYGYIRNYEMNIRGKSGKIISGIFSTDKVLINDREYLLSVMKDTTDRRKMEEAFKTNQMRLAMATQGARIGLWDWRIKTGETYYDEQWAEMIGYTLEELEPVSIETWVSHVHPDDLAMSDEKLQQYFAGITEDYECEARMRHKDGHWIWVLDRGKVVEWDRDGQPERMLGTHINITARKEMEMALLEERKLFTGGPTLVFLWRNTPGWPVEYVSSNVRNILGYTAEEILAGNPTFSSLLDPEDFEHMVYEVRRQIESGANAYEQTYRMRDATGRLRWFIDYTVVKRDSEGRVTHFHGYMNDITERKLIEETALELKAAAEKSNLLKSQFLANMSHEIRTPMNGIVGFLKLLSHSKLDQEQQEYVHEAQNASEILLYLLNDILDFSKIEAGKLGIENIRFPLRKTLGDAVRLFQPRARDKAVEMELQIDPEVPTYVMGDPSRFAQILNNLIGNAVKFTQRGHIFVRVRILDDFEEGVLLKVEVQDTGVGIGAAEVEGLFRPFTQADASTTRMFGGTGLGLAISKELAKMMGGDLTVKSVLDYGSTFTLTTRLRRDISGVAQGVDLYERISGEGVAQETDLSAESSSEPYDNNFSGRRLTRDLNILLVDDSDMNQKLISKVLAERQLRCDGAMNGLEALKMIGQKSYDLILMDCQMPVMDGYACSEAIRAQEAEGSRIPIIAMTANAMGGDRQKCLEAQMDDYLTKPVDFDRLFEILAYYGGKPSAKKEPDTGSSAASASAEASWSGFMEEKKQFVRQSGLDAETVSDLYTDFLTALENQIAFLMEMLDEGDYPALRAEAHKIKGTSGNLMLKSISSLALDLEGAVDQRSSDLCLILIEALASLLKTNR